MNVEAEIAAALARVMARVEPMLTTANRKIGQRLRRARERRERNQTRKT